MSNEPAEPPAVSPNEGPERALVPAIAGTGANEPIGAMPSGAAPPDDSEPKEEDTPDDASRQRMKDVASTGWAAAEANYYDRVGAAHSGSGDIYSYYYYGTAQVNGKKYSLERVPRQHREKVQIVYVRSRRSKCIHN